MEEPLGLIRDGSTHLEDQPTLGFKHCISLGYQPLDHLQPRLARKNRSPWFKFANFKLYLVFFRETYIGRVRDNGVKGRLDSREQIGLVKTNPGIEVQTGGICAGNLECL